MNTDILVALVVGLGLGIVIAGSIGRAKFLQVQQSLRDTEDYFTARIAELKASAKKTVSKKRT